jgi:hypothetical protein
MTSRPNSTRIAMRAEIGLSVEVRTKVRGDREGLEGRGETRQRAALIFQPYHGMRPLEPYKSMFLGKSEC